MLCLLNIEDFDEAFIGSIKEAERKVFVTDKLKRGNNYSLYGRVLLGYMLNKFYGINTFSYLYGENGKPYLKGEDIFFSISHSGKYVLCCLSENEIGCDVEKIKDYNPKVGKRFFTQKEAELLENKETEDLVFAELWTLKESILKKHGTGIGGGLDTYCFADYVGKEEFFAYGCNFVCRTCGDYMISVCSEKTVEKLQSVTKKEISEYIDGLI